MGPRITAEEQARRKEVVRLARRGIEREGRRSSDAARAAQDAYARGEIDLDELMDRALAESAQTRAHA